jgi:alpha-D-xyloside xylohydrolase
MREEGETDVVLLSRAGWAGIQRYGTVLWSGDIPSTFAVLKRQIPAGLNVSMSGIPWWNTDIGGFFRGNLEEDRFRELVIRWFQYGAFCPVMRLHGFRSPNEVWSFGEEAYPILKKFLLIRERMKPYILDQMRAAHESGAPVMRPLCFDFPGDPECEDMPDQYMFGPGLLVAPVTEEGARSRSVYLPAGAEWADAWTGEPLLGGQTIEAQAPLDRIPLYLRDGAKIPISNQ